MSYKVAAFTIIKKIIIIYNNKKLFPERLKKTNEQNLLSLLQMLYMKHFAFTYHFSHFMRVRVK